MFNPNKPWFRGWHSLSRFRSSQFQPDRRDLHFAPQHLLKVEASKEDVRASAVANADLGTSGAAKIVVFHRISSTDMGFYQFLRIELTSNQMDFFQHKRNTKRNAEKLAFRLLCFLRWFLGFLWMIIPKILDKANPICHISQPTAVLNNQLTLKNIHLLVPSARLARIRGPGSDLVRSHRSPGSCSESRTSEVRFFPKRFLGAANGCRSLNLSEYVGVHVGGVRSSLSWPKKFSPNRLVALPSGVGSLCIRARINSWPRLLQWWNAADRDAWTMFRKRVSRSRPRTRSVSEVISNQYSW